MKTVKKARIQKIFKFCYALFNKQIYNRICPLVSASQQEKNYFMTLLQVISTSPFDSKVIQKAGADRIQLVSALEIGGLTPSPSIIRRSIQCVDIPTMVMIRHHNNGFVHSQDEIQLFQAQIESCLNLGVKGLVFGGIVSSKQIDTKMIQKFLKGFNTSKVDVTFHKAFDQVNSIVRSYDELSSLGINRVLTQGGNQPILENFNILSQIIEKSKKMQNTKVLLGGGITFENVKQIIDKTKAEEIHIGTCVRKNKYGPVYLNRVQEFIKLVK